MTDLYQVIVYERPGKPGLRAGVQLPLEIAHALADYLRPDVASVAVKPCTRQTGAAYTRDGFVPNFMDAPCDTAT